MSGKLVRKPRFVIVKNNKEREILYSFYADDQMDALVKADEWFDKENNTIQSTDCKMYELINSDIKEYHTLEDVLTGYKMIYAWVKRYDVIEQKDNENKNVNHPNHYTQNGNKKETIEEIRESMSDEEYKGFLKGNIIKYISRCEYKGKTVEDLQKAEWYLKRLIAMYVNG